jgi:hypothetical protein
MSFLSRLETTSQDVRYAAFTLSEDPSFTGSTAIARSRAASFSRRSRGVLHLMWLYGRVSKSN